MTFLAPFRSMIAVAFEPLIESAEAPLAGRTVMVLTPLLPATLVAVIGKVSAPLV